MTFTDLFEASMIALAALVVALSIAAIIWQRGEG